MLSGHSAGAEFLLITFAINSALPQFVHWCALETGAETSLSWIRSWQLLFVPGMGLIASGRLGVFNVLISICGAMYLSTQYPTRPDLQPGNDLTQVYWVWVVIRGRVGWNFFHPTLTQTGPYFSSTWGLVSPPRFPVRLWWILPDSTGFQWTPPDSMFGGSPYKFSELDWIFSPVGLYRTENPVESSGF